MVLPPPTPSKETHPTGAPLVSTADVTHSFIFMKHEAVLEYYNCVMYLSHLVHSSKCTMNSFSKKERKLCLVFTILVFYFVNKMLALGI